MPNESRLRCGALKKKGSFNILALRCASKWPRRQHQRDRSACPRRDELPGALGTGLGDDALARDGGEVALEAEGAASRHLRRWAVAALGARARLALGSVARRPSPLREVHRRSEVYVYGGCFPYPFVHARLTGAAELRRGVVVFTNGILPRRAARAPAAC